jgi:hypothetical protein
MPAIEAIYKAVILISFRSLPVSQRPFAPGEFNLESQST